jgi:hypothetical protein
LRHFLQPQTRLRLALHQGFSHSMLHPPPAREKLRTSHTLSVISRQNQVNVQDVPYFRQREISQMTNDQ